MHTCMYAYMYVGMWAASSSSFHAALYHATRCHVVSYRVTRRSSTSPQRAGSAGMRTTWVAAFASLHVLIIARKRWYLLSYCNACPGLRDHCLLCQHVMLSGDETLLNMTCVHVYTYARVVSCCSLSFLLHRRRACQAPPLSLSLSLSLFLSLSPSSHWIAKP